MMSANRLRILGTLLVAITMIGTPAIARAQSDDDASATAPVASEHGPSEGLFAHCAIGGASTPGASGLGLLSGLTVRLGLVFVEANALDVAVEPGAGIGFDYVDEGDGIYCEDSDGEIYDDSVCDNKTPSIMRRAMSVDANVFVPHTSMFVGAGDRFDHGSQTAFGSVGYVWAPDDERNQYVLRVSAGDHYVAATIGIAVPLLTR